MNKAAIIFLSLFCFKVSAADQIPFLYLNQYYSYNAESPTEFVLENKKIDFNKIAVESSSSQVLVQVDRNQDFILNKSAIEIREQKTGSILEKKEFLKSESKYSFKKPTVPFQVCLVSRTMFSKQTVCKRPSERTSSDVLVDEPKQVSESPEVLSEKEPAQVEPVSEVNPIVEGEVDTESSASAEAQAKAEVSNTSDTSEAVIKVNGVNVGTSGIVVLKNKSESVVLVAHLQNGNIVRFSTRKRMIYPVRVFKKEGDSALDVRFVDIEKPKNNAWDQKLEVTDSGFPILLDPLIQVKQDIYFNKARLKSLSINYKRNQVEMGDLKKTYTYRTITEVFGIYLGLAGKNANLNVSINSNLGKGLTVVHEWPVLQKYHAQMRGYLYQMDIQSDDQNRVLNGKQSLFGLSGGFQYHLTPSIDLLGELHLQQDLFFKPHPTIASSVEVYTALNKQVAAIAEWTFFRRNFSEAALNAGIHYILPTSGSGVEAQAGIKYQVGAYYMQRFSIGQFSLLTEYVKRDQNTDVVQFAEQSLYYGLGYQFLY